MTDSEKEILRLRQALKPFSDYAIVGANKVPEDFIISLGSPLARKQLTMGDCIRARDALIGKPF